MSRARDTAGIIQYNQISFDSNNAVGIGSSIPDTKLDVNGGVRVTGIVTASSFDGDFSGGSTGDFSIADKIVHTGDTDTAIRFPAADTFTVETAGSEALRVDSSQRLLVGLTANVTTSDRNGNIQISGVNPSLSVTQTQTNNTGAYLVLASKGNGASDAVVDDSTVGQIRFTPYDGTDYASECARIMGQIDGTPGSNDVPGRLVFYTTADGAASPTERVRIDSSGRFGLGTNSPSSYYATKFVVDVGSAAQDGITIVSDSSNQGMIAFADDTSGTARYAGYVDYNHSTNALTFGTSSSERLKIDSSGNIGINVTNPGDFRSGAENLVVGSGSGAEGMTIYSATDASGRICFADGSGASDEERGVIQYAHDDNHMQFDTDATERLRIDSSGRLLQGKTSTKGSTGENIPTYCTEIASNNPNVLEIANNGTGSGSYSALVLSRSDATSVNGHTAVDSDDKIGEVVFIGADGSDRFNTGAAVGAIAQSDFSSNNCPTHLTFSTNGGSATASERLRIDSSGRLLVGTTSTSADTRAIIQARSSATDSTGRLYISSGNNAPADGDGIAELYFSSSAHVPSAHIAAQRDGGTWTAGSSLPTRLVFSTAANGASSSTERMRIDSSGVLTVGSGANTATQRAALLGGYTAFENAAGTGNPSITFNNDTDTGILNPSANTLDFNTAGSRRLRIDDNGRLMLGTTTEGSANADNFTVEDSGNCGITIRSGTTGSGNLYFSDATSGNAEFDGAIVYDQNDQRMMLYTASTERLRIDSSGVIIAKNGAAAEIDTLTDGATVTPNLDASVNFTITLGGNRTLANPSAMTAGQSGSIFVVQDGTGSRSFNAYGSYWEFIGGTEPTYTSTASAVDRIDYIVRSSTKIHAVFTANYS